LLTSISAFASPLEDLTDTLSGEVHAKISGVKPLLRHLCDELLLTSSEETALTKEKKIRNFATVRIIQNP